MIKGMYAAASAMIAGMNRQTVLSHNISNVDTPGFKSIMIAMEDWENTSVYPQSAPENVDPYLPFLLKDIVGADVPYVGELGLGVETTPEMVDYAQGAFQTTGEELDLAIQGDGLFRVSTPEGERYTRDGRFLRDAEGGLVTVGGYRVLDDNGQPIVLPEGDIGIALDGTIYIDNEEVATLGLVAFENPETSLVREPSNLYTTYGTPAELGTGEVVQGVLEMSNVNLAQIATQLVSVARAYEAAQQLLTVQDSLLGQAISSLGQF